ncbi:hypothetical protein Trco_001352 [Trichoderma cornu-damae]|uniref:Uncharacterized protein n=1 Tax=Trichoderma cornu-damae TaxID=654480 RepID=A0A9P8U0T7_9HYPO|nr:hypothetical protein Trco_001352 [Trichoderma cornu-damae]
MPAANSSPSLQASITPPHTSLKTQQQRTKGEIRRAGPGFVAAPLLRGDRPGCPASRLSRAVTAFRAKLTLLLVKLILNTDHRLVLPKRPCLWPYDGLEGSAKGREPPFGFQPVQLDQKPLLPQRRLQARITGSMDGLARHQLVMVSLVICDARLLRAQITPSPNEVFPALIRKASVAELNVLKAETRHDMGSILSCGCLAMVVDACCYLDRTRHGVTSFLAAWPANNMAVILFLLDNTEQSDLLAVSYLQVILVIPSKTYQATTRPRDRPRSSTADAPSGPRSHCVRWRKTLEPWKRQKYHLLLSTWSGAFRRPCAGWAAKYCATSPNLVAAKPGQGGLSPSFSAKRARAFWQQIGLGLSIDTASAEASSAASDHRVTSASRLWTSPVFDSIAHSAASFGAPLTTDEPLCGGPICDKKNFGLS